MNQNRTEPNGVKSESDKSKNSKKPVIFMVIGVILLIVSLLDLILLFTAINGRRNLIPLGIFEFILYGVAGSFFVMLSRKSKK